MSSRLDTEMVRRGLAPSREQAQRLIKMGQVSVDGSPASKPSVSVAMKNLRVGGYIKVDPYGNISLLDKGREIAEKIYERHTLISGWLTSMGVDPEIAAEDACRIEHVISSETFDALKNHVSRMSGLLGRGGTDGGQS